MLLLYLPGLESSDFWQTVVVGFKLHLHIEEASRVGLNMLSSWLLGNVGLIYTSGYKS